MKNEKQIQRAHDLLTGLFISEDPEVAKVMAMLPEDLRQTVQNCCNVLCWVLDHTHNVRFAQLLAEVETCLKIMGIEMEEQPGPPAPFTKQ